MSGITTWPQVGIHPARPLRWPAGIAVGALLAACGGNGIECAPGYVPDEAGLECVSDRKDVDPVDCINQPEQCK